MSEQETDSQSPSVTVSPALPTLPEPHIHVEDTPEPTPTHDETEAIEQAEKEQGETFISDTPLPPQIVIVTDDGESGTPELTINGELLIDEPLTPIPADITADESETTLPDDESSSYSTVTPESLNDDTKPILVDESDFQGPVIDFYRKKNILMTGATGFVGKAILWKLIQALRQDIGLIYILVRSGSIKRSKIGRPEERLRNEIFNNKVTS